MATLEDLKPSTKVDGLDPDASVEVVAVTRHGKAQSSSKMDASLRPSGGVQERVQLARVRPMSSLG